MIPPRRYLRIKNAPGTPVGRFPYWFSVLQKGIYLDGGESRRQLAEDALAWVGENITGPWSYAASTDIFKFAEDDDAFAFQMRWC